MSRYNYFEVLAVAPATFPADPQIIFGFLSDGFTFLNRGATVVEYSFDGVTLHGDLNPADSSKSVIFNGRTEDRVWFRAPAGAGTVRVEIWGSYGH
jgi:hypothetical protein